MTNVPKDPDNVPTYKPAVAVPQVEQAVLFTCPPPLIVNFPVPRYPIFTTPLLFHVDPLPETITLPSPPTCSPITAALQPTQPPVSVTTPPAVILREPVPLFPTLK